VFRLTPRSAVELAVAALLGFIGLVLFVGTWDEYKAGRAFNRAMDRYAGRLLDDARDELDKAIVAKGDYDAPKEARARLLIDEGRESLDKAAAEGREAPEARTKLDEARTLFDDLLKRQEAAKGRASLAVHMGLAVAELEVARADQPKREAPAQALRQARSRLERARSLHADTGDPHLGDLYVNLATLAFLEGNPSSCKEYLEKVRKVGVITRDALPFLCNLSGLVALHESAKATELEQIHKGLDTAEKEFGNARQFAEEWDTPYLNLGTAYAQAAWRDPAKADTFSVPIVDILARLQKADRRRHSTVCQAMAILCLRRNQPGEALSHLREAEQVAKLTWQSRFNRAIAQYLAAKAGGRNAAERDRMGAEARRDLAEILKEKRATRRDAFIASCVLGTLEADAGRPSDAIPHFESAAAAEIGPPDKPSEKFLRDAMPRVTRSLAALYYETGQFEKALACLERLAPQADAREKRDIADLLQQLRTPCEISDFSAKAAKLATDLDLDISALLVTPASAKPPAPENVTLTLDDALTKTSTPIPFSLSGALVQAVVLNPPQGRFRVKLTLTDGAGARAQKESDEIEIDREPPRILDPDPAPNATVKSLQAVRMQLLDVVSGVDMNTAAVTLRMPPGTPLPTRSLVVRGKYVYPSADGSIVRDAPAAKDLRCPLPRPLPAGKYRVLVHAEDFKGKVRNAEWGFTLAP
jgi:tetratricopeptide (TPR) repeat protein